MTSIKLAMLGVALVSAQGPLLGNFRRLTESDTSQRYSVETSSPEWGQSPDWMSLLELRSVDGSHDLWEDGGKTAVPSLTPLPLPSFSSMDNSDDQGTSAPEAVALGGSDSHHRPTISKGLRLLLERRGRRSPASSSTKAAKDGRADDVEAVAALDADMDMLVQRMVQNDLDSQQFFGSDNQESDDLDPEYFSDAEEEDEEGGETGDEESDDGDDENDDDDDDDESQSFVQVSKGRPAIIQPGIADAEDDDAEDGDDVLAQLTNFDDEALRSHEDDDQDGQTGEEAFTQISVPRAAQTRHL
jgi:hypothetical protein